MPLVMPLLSVSESVCCRKNDDTGACNGKCDKDQMAEKGVVTTATDFHV
jgi:hypothetical protein